MAILVKGVDFTTGDQVTAANLDNLVDAATFAAGAVDNATTQLSSGAIIVKDGGITSQKLDTNIAVSGTLGVTGVATLGNGAILGTPASGTVTNLTGTASININGTVGATTPAAGAFTTLAASGTATLSGASGLINFSGATLGQIVSTGDFYINPASGKTLYMGQGNPVAVNSTALAVTGTLACTGALTTNGGLQTFGANDSGGAGYRLVRVPNV